MALVSIGSCISQRSLFISPRAVVNLGKIAIFNFILIPIEIKLFQHVKNTKSIALVTNKSICFLRSGLFEKFESRIDDFIQKCIIELSMILYDFVRD